LCEVRAEAEETVELRALSIIDFKRRVLMIKRGLL